MTQKTNFPMFQQNCQQRVDRAIHYWFNHLPCASPRLTEAMHYAVFNGGKRIRPLLIYAVGNAFEVDLANLDASASAIELIHTYSLVHDDLPAMDDDDLRRGKPTCHIAFDEATAILVGDGLQCMAFQILSDPIHHGTNPKTQLEMIHVLAHASGTQGMVAGQALDLTATDQSLDIEHIETLHGLKTESLIRASIRLGALASGCTDDDRLYDLDIYASAVGLAFQIQDDILDIEGDTETLGKTQGADEKNHKATYPAVVGIREAKAKLFELQQQALNAIASYDESADYLRDIVSFIVSRDF